MEISGQYRGENFSAAFTILTKFIGNKISDIRNNGMSEFNMKLGSLQDDMSGSQLYNGRRIIGELSVLTVLSVVTTILGQMVPLKKNDSKDDDTWQMWLYIMVLRVTMEFWALWSPADVYGIVGNPTAAEGTLNNITTTFDGLFAGQGDDIIESGRYKYKTKWHRSLIKMTPGV